MEVLVIDTTFWCNRRVLVTGHTGFKGAWLTFWLKTLGAEVSGLSLSPEHTECVYSSLAPWNDVTEFLGDIRDADCVNHAFRTSRPEIVLHLAAQALVRRGYKDPVGTYSTNVIGTANVLHAMTQASSVQAALVVTSDKVYSSPAKIGGCSEDDALGGRDPYSASKVCTEFLVRSWRASWPQYSLVSARAGNVIGGGDRGEDRLIPDVLDALDNGEPIRLRNPNAKRPWQFVLEPLAGYLMYTEALARDPDGVPPSLNFGPPNEQTGPTVSEVVESVCCIRGEGTWVHTSDAANKQPETPTLLLNSSLARESIGWVPRTSLQQALEWTLEWHALQRSGGDVSELAVQQIARYLKLEEDS